MKTENVQYLNNAYKHALDITATVAITDLKGNILYVNDRFCETSGYSREELIGDNHRILKSGHHPPSFYQDLWTTIKRGEVWMGQIKNRAKDGNFYWVQTTIVPILDENREPHQYLSFRLDITEQKLAEEKLAIISNRLKILADNFPKGSISLIDPKLNFLFTGGAGYEAVGFFPGEVIGQPLKKVANPTTYRFIEMNLAKILAGETLTHEVFVRDTHYSIICKPAYDEKGALYGFVMVAVDISENKKAAIALKRSNELFVIGEELAQIGSWGLSVPTMEITFSSNTLQLLGQDCFKKTLAIDQVMEWIHPEDRDLLEKSFQDKIKENRSVHHEFRIIKPDGSVRIFQCSSKTDFEGEGHEVHILGVLSDVTERKKKEQEVLEGREILRNIADSIPGLVMQYVEIQDREAEILYISKRAEDLWEIPQTEILKDANIVWSRVHQEDLMRFLKSFRKSRASLSVWDQEFRIVMKDNRVKWVNAIGTPKQMSGGRILWDILALDVTSRKIAEENIEKNLELLTFQNTQLRDFCNIVSHNLRSPLVNTSMLVDFIEESDNEEERKVYIEKLKPVIAGLNEIFEELVESIQIQQDHQVQFEPIIFEDCFDKIISGFEGQITQSNAIIDRDFSKANLVNCPPKYLTSILHNLISNALKYRSPDRRLKISIETIQKQEKILLSIQDNGLGIDLKRHKDNLFKIRKVFHRHPDAKGFGLYITKTQVEAIKGRIWAESIPDKGSTFFVEFNNLTSV